MQKTGTKRHSKPKKKQWSTLILSKEDQISQTLFRWLQEQFLLIRISLTINKQNYHDKNDTILEENDEEDQIANAIEDNKINNQVKSVSSFLPDINSRDTPEVSNGVKANVKSFKGLAALMKERSSKSIQKAANKQPLDKIIDNLNEDTVETVNFLQIKSIFNNFTLVS